MIKMNNRTSSFRNIVWVLSLNAALFAMADDAPESLRKRKVPEPSNLKDFIRDKAAAIALGKALFWDMQVGSDNKTACASCHFHAGADNRVKNQISPGLLRVDYGGNADPDMGFEVGGPNHTLKKSDFPFRKLANVNDRNSAVLSDSNDVASSQGVFLEEFGGLNPADQSEIRTLVPDDIFHVNLVNTRRVEPRNTPTVINAVFNLRNFWDGRAQDRFISTASIPSGTETGTRLSGRRASRRRSSPWSSAWTTPAWPPRPWGRR